LKGVEFVMSEVSSSDIPKKNNKPFIEIATEYLSNWEALGFSIQVCRDSQSCFEAPVETVSSAVERIGKMGIANALMVSNTTLQRNVSS
jgi:hypothetical protein